MILKGLVDEDFLQYKEPSMFLIFPHCTLKCDKEQGKQICQNCGLLNANIHAVSNGYVINRYVNNPITKAVVIGGLEPFDDFEQLNLFVSDFRKVSDDIIVIYTGFYENEIKFYLEKLSEFKNIIIKFGRFIPDQKTHYDEILGVYLGSDNQYARKIS